MRIRVRADMSARIPSASASASMSFCVGPRAPTNPIVWPRSLFINNKIRLVATSLAHPHWQQQQQQAISLPIPPTHTLTHSHSRTRTRTRSHPSGWVIVALAFTKRFINGQRQCPHPTWAYWNVPAEAAQTQHSTDQSATIQRMNESRAEQTGRLRSREADENCIGYVTFGPTGSSPIHLHWQPEKLMLYNWPSERGNEAARQRATVVVSHLKSAINVLTISHKISANFSR